MLLSALLCALRWFALILNQAGLLVVSLQVGRNIVHGSDSTENGDRETGEQSTWRNQPNSFGISQMAATASSSLSRPLLVL